MKKSDSERLGLILLDVAPGVDGEFDRNMLERLGHPVIVCHGPAHGTLCPILHGETCEKFEAAHGIVFELDLDRPQHRAILQHYREIARPEVPIRAVVKPGQRERYAHLLDEVEVSEGSLSTAQLDGLAAEVEAADRFG